MKHLNFFNLSWITKLAISIAALVIILLPSNAVAARCNAEFKIRFARNNASLVYFTAKQHSTSSTTFAWNFGDNSIDSIASPIHQYANAGTYYVCLTVTTRNSIGDTLCNDTHCDSVKISGVLLQNCSAHFKSEINNALLKVKFKAKHHGTTYSWDFGDGSNFVSSNYKTYHTYATAGHYNVCLTVTDSSAGIIYCQSTWCDSIHLLAPAPPSCNAGFTVKQRRISNIINVKGSSNPGGTNYSWNFGDGTIVTSNTKDYTHTYATPGDYNVCLTVTDSAAGIIFCTASWCDSVHILPPPPVCNADFNSHHHGNSLKEEFHSNGNPHGTVYLWTFGDGDSSSIHNPVHIYQSAGAYQVCLTVAVLDTGNNVICSSNYCDSVYAGSIMNDENNIDRTAFSAGELPSASVYPNPMNGNALLHIESMIGSVSFSIFENTGRPVWQKENLVNGDFELSKAKLKPGFYIYRLIDTENNKVTGRIIVQ